MLDKYKELEPVIYGRNALKYIRSQYRAGGLCFPMHWHERIELLCVIEGSLWLDTKDACFEVKKGQTAVISPGKLHEGRAGEKGVTYHTVMFEAERFVNATLRSDPYFQSLIQGNIAFQICIEDTALSYAICRLSSMIDKEDTENILIAMGLTYEILGILYQYCEYHVQREMSSVDKAFGTILEYVNEHYTEKLSLEQISSQFGYNETYFCRRFKQITGFTFCNYIQILRIEQAQQLLRHTSEEVSVIAWKCGYEDISYFSNCFKKKVGYSPTEFRKMKIE